MALSQKIRASKVLKSIGMFLVVAGPGLIVMEADNDAGAVAAYTQAGAQYGLKMLWLLLILLPCTYFVQEMSARLGIVTGQGYAAMIYKRFGRTWGTLTISGLLLLNGLTLMTEFAAIRLAMEALGVSPLIGTSAVALGLMAIVILTSYKLWERIILCLCALDILWVFIAMRTGLLHTLFHPQASAAVGTSGLTAGLVFLIVAIIGTTIAPWQLFFQQSCVSDKRLRFSDLKFERIDTLIGAVFTIVVAGCMMLVGYGAAQHGVHYTNVAQMATGLGDVFGPSVRIILLILFLNASVLGSVAISLSSAWAYGEVRGWPHSLQLKPWEAPWFYLIYGGFVGISAAVALIPGAPLHLIIMGVQVLSGIMLPPTILFMQLLINDTKLMGPRFSNRPWNNAINWAIISLLVVLSAVLAAQIILPH